MIQAEELAQYAGNVRALLASNEALYRMAIDRQIRFALLPKMTGTRAQLEPHLWSLLVLCLDGVAAAVPPYDDAQYNKAAAAAATRKGLASSSAARYPQAAQALATSLSELREFGVLPKPKLKPPPTPTPTPTP